MLDKLDIDAFKKFKLHDELVMFDFLRNLVSSESSALLMVNASQFFGLLRDLDQSFVLGLHTY